MNKFNDLKSKSAAELNTHLVKLSKEHFDLRQEKLASGVKKSHRLSQIRKEIAQVKTIIGFRGK
jgi:large subunit ribosomal protein L29